MVINEVFPNPTVKQIIFQIKFPSLFYIENKIGDFQVRVMEQLPKSELLHRRQMLFADLGPKGKIKPVEEEFGRKVWQFSSNEKHRLSITNNSLDIVSEHHKTYNLEGADKFRDIIEFSLNNFFDVMAIPLASRIGLRYIDECPLPRKNNETFGSYYNSVFPIERFNLANAKEMFFRTVVKRGRLNLIYMESLQKRKGKYIYS